jgi:hypothetical protein
MKSALSAQQGTSSKIEQIEKLSNQVGLMKCADGVFRRISIRYLHDKFLTAQNKSMYVNEVKYIGDERLSVERFVDDELNKKGEEDRPYQKFLTDPKDERRAEVTFNNYKEMVVFEEIIDKQMENVKCRRRSNVLITFIDDANMAPVILGSSSYNLIQVQYSQS